MAIAIYQATAGGRHHWAESTSPTTLQHLAAGEWVLYDDTPATPPPAADPLDAAMAQRALNTASAFSVAQRGASVAAVQDAISAGDIEVGSGSGDPAAVPTGLGMWFAGRSAARYGKATAAFIGSSTTRGSAASTPERRYVDLLGDAMHVSLNGDGINGGRHIPAQDDSWTTTGTITTSITGLGINAAALVAGAVMSNSAKNCTGFSVQHQQGPGVGPFTVSIDGGAAVTVTPDTSGSLRNDGVWSSPVLTRGTHTITLTAVSATVVEGAYAHDGDLAAGLQVYNGGRSGTTSADYTGAAATSIAIRITQLNPILVGIMIGSNDYAAGRAKSAYKANMQQLVDAVLAAASRASIVLFQPYRRLDVTSPAVPWSAYGEALAEIASAAPTRVHFVDISAAPPYPTENTETGDPYDLLVSDSVHQTDAGHALMADLSGRSLYLPARVRAMAPTIADVTAPAAPTGVQAVAGNTTVALSWNPSTDNVGVVAYRVRRGSTVVGDVAGLSFTDTGLTNTTNYSHTLAALDAAANESAQSAPVSTTPTASPALAVYSSDTMSGSALTYVSRITDIGLGGQARTIQTSTNDAALAVSGGVLARGAASGSQLAVLPMPTVSQALSAKLTALPAASGTGAIFLVVRRASIATSACYRAQITPTTATLQRTDSAGALTSLGVSSPVVAGDTIEVRAVGTTIGLYKNGTLVGEVTDTNVTAAGFAGLSAGSTSTSFQLDDMTWKWAA